MAEQVWATDENTGLPMQIPERWLRHPVLGRHLREEKNGKARTRLMEPAIDTAGAVVEDEVGAVTDSELDESAPQRGRPRKNSEKED